MTGSRRARDGDPGPAAVSGSTDEPAPASAAADWSLVVEPDGRTGAENMAIDWALLRAAQRGSAFLRLYRWNPPCLSFGRHEPALERYDRARITELGLDTVRRPTGGRAVWHEHEVTYAVAARAEMFGSLQDAYIAIHGMLAAALRRLGVELGLAGRPSSTAGPGAGACFAAPVGGEIVSGGRKLVGSAQVREGTAFLQHGSILLRDGQDLVTTVTRRAAPRPSATALTALLGRPVTFKEVSDVVATEAQTAWTGSWQRLGIEPDPSDLARFRNDGWTWRR